MATVAVFVFLLDNLPALVAGFDNAVNEALSLQAAAPATAACDPLTADSVLAAAVGRGVDAAADTDEETDADELADDSMAEGRFLVALFESAGELTAHTCAGALLHPRWAITDAACRAALADALANHTAGSSSYTVIADARDALHEGSAHRVTGVLAHRAPPSVALLRLEPPAPAAAAAPPALRPLRPGDALTVYGWRLDKSPSGEEVLRRRAVAAAVLEAARCAPAARRGLVCLHTDEDITDLGPGSPVVRGRGGRARLAAVLHSASPLLAYALPHLHTWIDAVIHDT